MPLPQASLVARPGPPRRGRGAPRECALSGLRANGVLVKFHDFSITTGAYCFVVLGIIFYSLSLAGYIEEVVHQDVCFPLNFLFFVIGTGIGQVYFYRKHLV